MFPDFPSRWNDLVPFLCFILHVFSIHHYQKQSKPNGPFIEFTPNPNTTVEMFWCLLDGSCSFSEHSGLTSSHTLVWIFLNIILWNSATLKQKILVDVVSSGLLYITQTNALVTCTRTGVGLYRYCRYLACLGPWRVVDRSRCILRGAEGWFAP